LRLISENIATLPIDTFTRAGGVRKPYRPRPDYLNFGQPGLSRIDYFSQVMLSLLTDGNAYIVTIRGPDGAVVGLIVLDPTMVSVSRVRGQIEYRINGRTEPLNPVYDIMHIKGMCLPGALTGLSPIAYAAETVGVGLNAQRYGSSFFENGALSSAVIQSPGKFSKEAGARFRETWNAEHQGVGNANKIGVLTEGATLNKVSITPDEAQFLQTRQFSVPDVCRVYGVPPHLVADASNSTSWGSGLAEQNSAFGQFSLRGWTERVEEGHDRLLTTDGLPDVFMKFNMDAVLRASFKERMEGYQIAIDAEVMVPNEARKQEDWAPVPWGDVPPPTVRREAVGPADSNVQPSTGPPVSEPPPTIGGTK
jgi:HK97 family phage portal protein